MLLMNLELIQLVSFNFFNFLSEYGVKEIVEILDANEDGVSRIIYLPLQEIDEKEFINALTVNQFQPNSEEEKRRVSF